MNELLRKTGKFVLTFALVITTFPSIQQSYAVDTCKMEFRKNSKVAFVCDKGYKLDVAPFVLDGAMYLPVRFFFDRFGSDISWSGKTAHVHYNNFDFVVLSNTNKSTLNGTALLLSKNAVLKNDRLFMASADFDTVTKNWSIQSGFVATTDKVTVTIDKSKIKYLWNDFTRPILNGNGKSLTLSKIMTEPDTKVVIVQIWHTACAGCVNVLKLFESMWTKYQGKGLKVVSINTDGVGFEDSRDARIEDTGITYEICSDPEYLLKPDWYDPVFPNYYVLVPGDKYIKIFQEGWDTDDNAVFEKTVDSLCTGN